MGMNTQRWGGTLRDGEGHSELRRDTQRWRGILRDGEGHSEMGRYTQSWEGSLIGAGTLRGAGYAHRQNAALRL